MMYRIMKAFVESSNWPHEEVEKGKVLRFNLTGDNGTWMCIAIAEEDIDQCIVMSYLTPDVPEQRRAAVAEYITRANYGLRIGNFEMDLDAGDVRFRTSIDVDGESLQPDIFRQLVMHNATQFDRYLPGLEAVLGGASPRQAVSEVEGARADEAGPESNGEER